MKSKKVGRPAAELPSKPLTKAEILAQKIRRLRRGRSVEDLAAAADVSVSYWHKLERAAVLYPRDVTVDRVLGALRGV